MKIKIFFLLGVLFFIGCHNESINIKEYEKQIDANDKRILNINDSFHTICLNGMQGPYPETIKDKKLGEGLLNFKYKKIEQIILNNLKEDREIKIDFVSNSRDEDVKKIIIEMKKFFNKNPKFLVVFNKAAYPDVKVEILKDKDSGIITFVVYFENKRIFKEKSPKFVKLSKSLKELEKESFALWSRVEIPTNNGGKAVYYIMKRPVLVSEFYHKYTKHKRAVTGVSFDEADEYCFKHGGSISSLYVFEYALRKGLIIPPTKYGATQEFVAPFDPASKEDERLKLPGDIVFIKNNLCENKSNKKERDLCYARHYDYSIVYVFDFNDYSYKEHGRIGNQNITFRCIRRGE